MKPGTLALFLLALAAAPPAGVRAQEPGPADAVLKSAIYLYNLADFQGDVKGSFRHLAYDRPHDEVYVWGGVDVQVFGETGMEIHAFGSAEGLPSARAVVPLPNDELLVEVNGEQGPQFLRCNYRGDPIGPFAFTAMPGGVRPGFDEVRTSPGRLYFLDARAFRVVATDLDGRYAFHRDLAKPIFAGYEDEEATDTASNDLTGFDVDGEGNILVTVAAQFRAVVISPDGKARTFGGKGSRPGKFNVAGPITRDERGYFYVADTLRSVILVFSPDLRFLFEFGGRGESPGRLVVPTSIAAGNGKLFVSQGRNRGVSVFRLE